MGKYGEPGRNVSGERMLEPGSEQEMGIANTYFKKMGINDIHGKGLIMVSCQRELCDNVIVEKSALGRLMDVHVAKGAGVGVSVYFLAITKVKGGQVLEKRRGRGITEKAQK